MVMYLFACAWLARCALLQQVSCRTKRGSPVLCEGLQQRRSASSQRGVDLQAVCLGSNRHALHAHAGAFHGRADDSRAG